MRTPASFQVPSSSAARVRRRSRAASALRGLLELGQAAAAGVFAQLLKRGSEKARDAHLGVAEPLADLPLSEAIEVIELNHQAAPARRVAAATAPVRPVRARGPAPRRSGRGRRLAVAPRRQIVEAGRVTPPATHA